MILSISHHKWSSEHHTLQARHVALLRSDFEVAVDDAGSKSASETTMQYDRYLRDGKQDTGTTSQGAHKIACNTERTDTGTTKRCSSGNDTLEFFVHRLFTVSGHNEALFLELFGDIAGARAGNFNPCLREDSAGNEHVRDVDGSMDWIQECFGEVEWRRHVVGYSRDGVQLSRSFTRLPDSNQSDE